jgi:pyruvate/2-oxoglutarate dehydrogenase complex dihydrolipoamide acyltransferase (E2) component
MNRFSTAETVLAALHEGHMQHLDEGTIHAWLDDALAGDEAAAVAKHVAECGDCAALVAEARGMIVAAGNIVAALDDVRGGVIPSSTPARATAGQSSQTSLWRRLHFTPARAALAATLLVAVGSVLTVRRAGQGDDQRIPPASTVVAPIIAQPTSRPSSPQPQAQTSAEVAHKVAPAPSPTPSNVTSSNVASAPAIASPPASRALNALAAKPSSGVADAQQIADSVRSATVDRVAAAPAASANAPAVAVTGAAKPSADSIRVAPERRAKVTALEEVAATAKTSALRSFAAGPSVEGCYEVRIDSASSSVAGILPRFELTSNSGVRSVTPEGHPDSTAAICRWERVTPNVVRVRFAEAREQQPLTLQFGSTSLTGRAGAGDRATNVAVARIACRR